MSSEKNQLTIKKFMQLFPNLKKLLKGANSGPRIVGKRTVTENADFGFDAIKDVRLVLDYGIITIKGRRADLDKENIYLNNELIYNLREIGPYYNVSYGDADMGDYGDYVTEIDCYLRLKNGTTLFFDGSSYHHYDKKKERKFMNALSYGDWLVRIEENKNTDYTFKSKGLEEEIQLYKIEKEKTSNKLP